MRILDPLKALLFSDGGTLIRLGFFRKLKEDVLAFAESLKARPNYNKFKHYWDQELHGAMQPVDNFSNSDILLEVPKDEDYEEPNTNHSDRQKHCRSAPQLTKLYEHPELHGRVSLLRVLAKCFWVDFLLAAIFKLFWGALTLVCVTYFVHELGMMVVVVE